MNGSRSTVIPPQFTAHSSISPDDEASVIVAREVRAALIPEEAAEFDKQWREVMASARSTNPYHGSSLGWACSRALYTVTTDDHSQQQVDALPAEALAAFAELRTVLEVASWNGAPYHRHKPDGPMRALSFGPNGEGDITGAQILAERSRGGIGKLAIQADLRAPCGPGQGNSHRGA
jgi:hypothetical protein